MRIDRMIRLNERATVERLLHLVFELDPLLAMADTIQQNRWVIPHLHAGPLEFSADGVVHPFVRNAVANPVHIDPGLGLRLGLRLR